MQRAFTTNYFRVLGEAIHCCPLQAWDETARFGAKHPFPAALHGYSAQEVPDLTAKRLLAMLLLGFRSQYRKKCDREHANVLTKLFKQHPFGCRLTLNSLLPHVVSEQQATCKGTVWVLPCVRHP